MGHCPYSECGAVIADRTTYRPLPPDGSELLEVTGLDPEALREHLTAEHKRELNRFKRGC